MAKATNTKATTTNHYDAGVPDDYNSPGPARPAPLPPAPRAASNRAYPDTWVVRLRSEANPKRGKSAERFALYRDGMTVGEYLDASSALTGSKRGKWSCDLRWDAERGFIELESGV